MKVFGIYRNNAGEYRAVKRGFSLAGLVLGWIWLLYRGLYVRGTVFFLAYALLGNLIYGMEKSDGLLMNGLLGFLPMLQHPPLIENELLRFGVGLFRTLAFGLVIGFFSNDWYAAASVKDGFLHIMDVGASQARLAIEQAGMQIAATSSSPGIREGVP